MESVGAYLNLSVEEIQNRPEILQQLGAKDGDVVYITEDSDGYTLRIESTTEQTSLEEQPMQIDPSAVHEETYQQVQVADDGTNYIADNIVYGDVQQENAQMEYVAVSEPQSSHPQMVSILKSKEERVILHPESTLPPDAPFQQVAMPEPDQPHMVVQNNVPAVSTVGHKNTAEMASDIFVENRPQVLKQEELADPAPGVIQAPIQQPEAESALEEYVLQVAEPEGAATGAAIGGVPELHVTKSGEAILIMSSLPEETPGTTEPLVAVAETDAEIPVSVSEPVPKEKVVIKAAPSPALKVVQVQPSPVSKPASTHSQNLVTMRSADAGRNVQIVSTPVNKTIIRSTASSAPVPQRNVWPRTAFTETSAERNKVISSIASYATPTRKRKEFIERTYPENTSIVQCTECGVTFNFLPDITDLDDPMCLKCDVNRNTDTRARRSRGSASKTYYSQGYTPPAKKHYPTITSLTTSSTFECPECPKKFVSREALIMHMAKHNEENSFTAASSDNETTTLTPRMATKTYGKSTRGYISPSASNIDDVKDQEPSDGSFEPPENKRAKKDGRPNKYKCMCSPDATFASNIQLQKHTLQRHNTTTKKTAITCLFCLEVFEDVNKLISHIDMHNPECSQCGNVFENEKHMKNHKCVLDGEGKAESYTITVQRTKPGDKVKTYASPATSSNGTQGSANKNVAGADEGAGSEGPQDAGPVVRVVSQRPDEDDVTGFFCKYCPKLFCNEQFLEQHMKKHQQ